MEQHANDQNQKDPQLWKIAKKRADFKRDLITYLGVNAFLWVIWLLTLDNEDKDTIPWPVWPTIGWGIAILFQYLDAYHFPKENLAEREYEKLKAKYK